MIRDNAFSLLGKKIVVCGGGGFIGGHLVHYLRSQGLDVFRSVDNKPIESWYQREGGVENLVLDLVGKAACERAVAGADVVFNLAADMGGMGFIENNKALCMLSVLINTHLLLASRAVRIQRYFFASSACVYNADKQRNANASPLAEEDVSTLRRGLRPAVPDRAFSQCLRAYGHLRWWARKGTGRHLPESS
jgi:nucleoside-diphosphate-sugar epimerase